MGRERLGVVSFYQRTVREKVVGHSDEGRKELLNTRDFTRADSARILRTVLAEEGHPPESAFDFGQGITSVARGKTHQNARLAMDKKAKLLLGRIA